MEKKMTMDMTTGSPAKLIVRFGLPLLFGSVLQQLYNFVDTIVVGRGISMEALASVGVTGSLNFLVLGFIMGMAQGVSILVSQFFGSRQPEQMRKSITMSFWLCYGCGLLVTVLSVIGSRWMLTMMNTPANIIDDAVVYLHIIFGGTLISLTYNFLAGILRAVGDSKNPLVAMVIAFVVNTILDILFVIPLKMGVAGAAYATVIAQGVSAVYCLVCVRKIEALRLHREDWAWNGALFSKSFFLSLPVAIMNSITAVGVIFLATAINGYGSDYVAAYSASSKIIVILEQLSSSFGMAVATFAGQNMGAGKIERIRSGVRQTNLILMGMNLASAIIMTLFGRTLLILMVSDSNAVVLAIALHTLIFQSWFLVALGLLWVYRCALQAMGDTFFPMLSGLLEFAARTFFIIVLPKLMGFDGVLSAEVSAWISAALMLGVTFYIRLHHLNKQALAV